MTDEVWHAATHAPTAPHPLEQQTPLYIDLYIALRILGMPYSRYMHETSQHERHLYRLFLLLEQAKEEHARDQAQQFAEAEREALAATGQNHTRG